MDMLYYIILSILDRLSAVCLSEATVYWLSIENNSIFMNSFKSFDDDDGGTQLYFYWSLFINNNDLEEIKI